MVGTVEKVKALGISIDHFMCLPEALKYRIENGFVSETVLDAIRRGQDGRGPRTKKAKVNFGEKYA